MMKHLMACKTLFCFLATSALCLLSSNVNAVTSATGSFTAMVNVGSYCTLSNGVMNFGNYEPLSKNENQPLDAVASFDIMCTKGTSASISLSEGANSAHAHGTTRALSAGGNTPDYMNYELYLTPSRSTVWSQSNVQSYVAGNKNSRRISIYGRIPPAQDVGAGYYTDSVNITANF